MEAQIKDYGRQIDLKREFERVHQKLNFIIEKQTKPVETWVKVGFIQHLTGWNKEQMRRARSSGLIIYKKNKDGIAYKLESLNEKFILHNKQT